MFGHLKNKKGVPFFVQALLRTGLADRFHLLLVGEIEDALQAILPEVAHSHVTTVDRFDLLPYYLASDWIVLPSHYDGFPNVLIEAASLGRPLIASAVGGMLDALTDGENALLFPPADEHACRNAIARAAELSDAEWQRMSAAAATLSRERFDAKDETRRYLEVLDAIADPVRNAANPAARRLWWRGAR
jgi:glycosyltransferase involved in cell wall biosynthesis